MAFSGLNKYCKYCKSWTILIIFYYKSCRFRSGRIWTVFWPNPVSNEIHCIWPCTYSTNLNDNNMVLTDFNLKKNLTTFVQQFVSNTFVVKLYRFPVLRLKLKGTKIRQRKCTYFAGFRCVTKDPDHRLLHWILFCKNLDSDPNCYFLKLFLKVLCHICVVFIPLSTMAWCRISSSSLFFLPISLFSFS